MVKLATDNHTARKEVAAVAKTCSFTGHRNIKDSHRDALPALLRRAINYAYEQGCREFLAGGAIGFDTLAAREVIRFRIAYPDVRLVLLLPCIEQDAKWSEAQKDAYRYTLSVADEVVYVSDEYTPSCIRERNFMLASRADIMICYLGRRDSGSGQTAAMADKMGKEIYNLYPALEAGK